jgi:hypothetical protein
MLTLILLPPGIEGVIIEVVLYPLILLISSGLYVVFKLIGGGGGEKY